MFRVFLVLFAITVRVQSLDPTDKDGTSGFVDDIYETLSSADNEENGTKKIQSAVETVDEMEANNKNISGIFEVPAVLQNTKIFLETKKIYNCLLTINNKYKHLQNMLEAESDEDRKRFKKIFVYSAGSFESMQLSSCIKQTTDDFASPDLDGLSYIVRVATILKEKDADDADQKFSGLYSSGVTSVLKGFIVQGYEDFLSYRQNREYFEEALTEVKDKTTENLKVYAGELYKAKKILG